MESGSGLSFVKSYADLKAEIVGREAAEQACSLLDARSIISQKIPLVFDQFTGADLLEVLANLLSAEAVQKGRSLFAGKLGQAIAAAGVTIVDDGRMANGLATAPFDDEGTPTRETVLIDSGELSGLLYNAYTAKKNNTQSNGHASRGSFKAPPGISPTNLYFKPGQITPEKMISSLNKGIYITRLMGLHTANPISGDFSLGAAGIMIENGEKTFPVRGITIAGNLVDLLRSIEVVGSDLRFITNIGSPTLLINDLTVSGS
jgi:PmbA protein